MKHKHRANDDFTYKLLQLQNLVKRDPSLYFEEFYEHYTYFNSLLQMFLMDPTGYNHQLADLIMFLAHVSPHFKSDLAEYPNALMDILKQYYSTLDADMRMCLTKALILMRNKGIIEAIDIIPLFFHLLRAKDKTLRKFLRIHIITDIKNMNAKHKNMKLNNCLQSLMFKIMKEDSEIASKMSLDIMIQLYRKNVWRDAKTVNAIATACFSKINKILVAAHHFFLGNDEKDEEDDSSESENEDTTTPSVRDVMAANKVNKKTRRRKKILKRTKQALQKSKTKKDKDVFDFSAIHLIYDPQGMAEKLLKKLNEMNERYEIKMMVMNLISRLVGVHQLILLNFYELLLRFLKPHQREVTKILTFAAQAAHECVPPDAVEPVIKTIAYNFVTERNSFEVMTVGINAIKEICARCPLAISQDLLHDIAEYRRYKNKNVQMAAKSVIQLFRKINPHMLKRKFRDRPTEATKELDTIEYGASKAKSYIPGSEALPIEPSNEDENIAGNADEDDDSDGSWVNVSHSEDEENLDEDKKMDLSKDDHEENIAKNEDQDNLDMKKKDENVDTCNTTTSNKGEKNDESSYENSTVNVNEKEKAMIVSQSRILSQEEFRKLKVIQIAKQVKFAKGKKRQVEELEVNNKEIVSLRDIEKLHKKPKANKETRLATILEGREGREKFGKKERKNPLSGTTHKVHNKNKAFNMIKHKLRAKQKRSFKDKQIALRNALLKRKRNK